MSAETFFLNGAGSVGRFVLFLRTLRFDKPWKVTIERCDARRTVDQNAKLRAMERDLAEFTGHDPDEIHEVLLAGRFGTKAIKVREGVLIERPARRSSDLTKKEMADYITWVQAFGANLGVEL